MCLRPTVDMVRGSRRERKCKLAMPCGPVKGGFWLPCNDATVQPVSTPSCLRCLLVYLRYQKSVVCASACLLLAAEVSSQPAGLFRQLIRCGVIILGIERGVGSARRLWQHCFCPR